ncbi:MAG TPA: zf-HC2 domain-containing protein [Vicinamibacterales bacterium]|nr:zf-HC2 domain-containing protein [Vicinamibacterales bacterium]
MFCDEALDAVEAIAAGELTPEGRIRAHLATCPNCAAALKSARALDEMLRRRPAPQPPAHFTTKTMARVRRARWRSDQHVDFAFNLVIGVIVLATLGGVWLLLVRTGLIAVGGGAFDVIGAVFVTAVRSVAPALPVYSGAAALVGTALAIWWWAERSGMADS